MDGLDIAWKRGIKQILAESGSLTAVNTFNGQAEEVKSSLVQIIRHKMDWNIKVLYVPCLTNMVADYMTALGDHNPIGLPISDCPKQIAMELLQESVGKHCEVYYD
ncbi:hypothetical protein PVK06_003876 [Gossypium arboreum]|uniref:RNase H type-1 domain-containing protein n=1 Tax=Gossypium arboreum TaxID=29729 RepID=A0ABR0QQF0_GOSAR|nr:hypothetical protein PVK06_003876 [Gossypium arboreum]